MDVEEKLRLGRYGLRCECGGVMVELWRERGVGGEGPGGEWPRARSVEGRYPTQARRCTRSAAGSCGIPEVVPVADGGQMTKNGNGNGKLVKFSTVN